MLLATTSALLFRITLGTCLMSLASTSLLLGAAALAQIRESKDADIRALRLIQGYILILFGLFLAGSTIALNFYLAGD